MKWALKLKDKNHIKGDFKSKLNFKIISVKSSLKVYLKLHLNLYLKVHINLKVQFNIKEIFNQQC